MDVAAIMCPTDAQNLARIPRMQAICDVYAHISAQYQPRRILEIGVRAGYGAYAWITGSGVAESYIGIDIDDRARYGGPWLPWARKLLDTLDIAWTILEADSQAMTDLPYHDLDLIHVDGDHTYSGCLHDMALCWPSVVSGGVMVVDDATYLPGPHRACAEFARSLRDVERIYLEPSPTGSMVYVKGQGK